jgi:uncharacterized protein
MEDLLASIRKAIDEDIGEMPAAASRPAADSFKGSMQALRVRVGEEVNAAASEIQELRSRIQKNREQDQVPPMRTVSPPPPPSRSGGFAEILSGDTYRPPRRPDPVVTYEPPPPLRRSFAEAELPAAAPQPGFRTREREFAPRIEEARYLPPPDPRAAHPDPILSPEASAAAGGAFNRLAETILARASGDRSLEDMTRDLLRGMLKQWLDENLPSLVERLVREEIERVARRGR